MLQYRKGPEPKELKPLRNTPGSTFDKSKGKELSQPLRRALGRDQGWLCAYCQQRITEEKMQVEHWLCQSKNKENQWDWRYMLGVCHGQINFNGILFKHCDQSRQDVPLFLNPVEGMKGNAREHLHYYEDGSIVSPDDRAQKDIVLLNLDSENKSDGHFLRRNRKAAIDELRRKIQQEGKSVAVFNKYLDKFKIDSGGHAVPFSEVMRYLLLKWKRRFRVNTV